LNHTRVPQLLNGHDLPEVGPLEEFYITMPELPAHTVVLDHIRKHPHSAPKPQKSPVWARLCVWIGTLAMCGSGIALILLGAFLILVGIPR
jgi:hypothetical protein